MSLVPGGTSQQPPPREGGRRERRGGWRGGAPLKSTEPRGRTGAAAAMAGHPETLRSEDRLLKVKVNTVTLSK